MKKPVYMIASLCLWTVCMPTFAQHSLTVLHNLPRPGDEIIKRQVEYKDPGRSGENVLWDFGKLKTTNDEYKLFYKIGKDSLLAGIEHRTIYYHSLTNDSRCRRGFLIRVLLFSCFFHCPWRKFCV